MNPKNPIEAYQWLVEHGKETTYYESMAALLEWDMRTFAPSKAGPYRADEIAFLAKKIHSQVSNPKMGECIALAQTGSWKENSVEAVNLREWLRDHQRATLLPEKLVTEIAKVSAQGQSAWELAKPKNDWNSFKPFLRRLIELKREEASVLKIGNEAYDGLLDYFEPGESTVGVTKVLMQLKDALVPLLDQIEKKQKQPKKIDLSMPLDRQQKLNHEVACLLGYDAEAGRIDPSVHPFSTTNGLNDNRITTRYLESDLTYALLSTIHETGHALYEQGLPTQNWGTPLCRPASFGMHESQSRLWENIVARSQAFWKFLLPKIQSDYGALKNVTLEDFVDHLNRVERTFIRTESDELTYNLHILLRFELELALIRNQVSVDDLPSAWNEKMKSYLGITPPDHSQGVLQDVHWSAGLFGYFPTYTLGTIYSAQWAFQAQKELGNLHSQFEKGQFSPLLQWLRKNLHQEGTRFRPRVLVKKITGNDLSAQYLIEYFKSKY